MFYHPTVFLLWLLASATDQLQEGEEAQKKTCQKGEIKEEAGEETRGRRNYSGEKTKKGDKEE